MINNSEELLPSPSKKKKKPTQITQLNNVSLFYLQLFQYKLNVNDDTEIH